MLAKVQQRTVDEFLKLEKRMKQIHLQHSKDLERGGFMLLYRIACMWYRFFSFMWMYGNDTHSPFKTHIPSEKYGVVYPNTVSRLSFILHCFNNKKIMDLDAMFYILEECIYPELLGKKNADKKVDGVVDEIHKSLTDKASNSA